MRYFTLLFIFGMAAGVLGCQELPQSTPNQPNIIIVMADDMGIGDPGAYNPESKVPTPHIDRLASEGIRMTDAHSPSAVCTPTRYGLLTGRYAWRTSLKSGVLWGYSPAMIDPSRATIPSFLKEQGYYTAGIGKWHLGLGIDSTDYFNPFPISPGDAGFDYYYGIPASLDMDPYVYFENDRTVDVPTDYVEASAHRRQNGGGFWREGPMAPRFDHEEVLPHTTEKVLHFLDERSAQGDQPFFLYVPLSAPHTPWLPTDAFRGQSGAGYYGDFAVQVDDALGQILDRLDQLDLTENTIIVYTSDNGAHWPEADIEQYDHRANLHHRGQKADIWEGGHRVPFVARWPGHIPTGTVNNEIITLTDLFATIAAILQTPLPEQSAEDSYNVLPALMNESLDEPIREATVHHSLRGMFALRQGDWKYIEGLGSGGFTPPSSREPEEGEPPGQLYNLKDDPSEQNNVYADHPEVVERLKALLDTYRDAGYSAPRVNQ